MATGGRMDLAHKQARVDAKALDDVEGIVEAVVSVTNIVDNVNDVIEPGAYTKTLEKRLPKGVWSHDTTIPVARTIKAVELMPGDDRLPAHLQQKDAGGVLVKMQFNLNTTRGRDAYEDIKFFGHEQEWSIGYSVPEGESKTVEDTGTRYIKSLDWYEYSPVLFGAAPGTTTIGVKSTKEIEVADDEEKGPIASHAVGFADDRPWNAAMYKNIRSPADKAYYSKIFAYLEDGEDPTFKTNYTFIHHYVAKDGSPGAASLGGIREGVSVLNGARRGTKLTGSARKGVYNHLARHYREGGETPPELKSDEYLAEIMQLKDALSGIACDEIDALIEEGKEIHEIKSLLEDTMEAEITETTEAEVVPADGGDLRSLLNEAVVALNLLSERLESLEEKGGDAAGFSNTAPDSPERAEGAGAVAPEVVADLSHGGTLTPEEMAVAGSPAGGDSPAPKKAPKAKAPDADDAEKADDEVEEVKDEAEVVESITVTELREFQNLLTFSDFGE